MVQSPSKCYDKKKCKIKVGHLPGNVCPYTPGFKGTETLDQLKAAGFDLSSVEDQRLSKGNALRMIEVMGPEKADTLSDSPVGVQQFLTSAFETLGESREWDRLADIFASDEEVGDVLRVIDPEDGYMLNKISGLVAGSEDSESSEAMVLNEIGKGSRNHASFSEAIEMLDSMPSYFESLTGGRDSLIHRIDVASRLDFDAFNRTSLRGVNSGYEPFELYDECDIGGLTSKQYRDLSGFTVKEADRIAMAMEAGEFAGRWDSDSSDLPKSVKDKISENMADCLGGDLSGSLDNVFVTAWVANRSE